MTDPHVIHLTNRPPISITDEAWPVVGRAVWFDGPTPRESDESAYVRVRKSSDGKYVVYGVRRDGRHTVRAGELAEPGETPAITRGNLVHAVIAVCAIVGIEPQRVFDDLPPETVS